MVQKNSDSGEDSSEEGNGDEEEESDIVILEDVLLCIYLCHLFTSN